MFTLLLSSIIVALEVDGATFHIEQLARKEYDDTLDFPDEVVHYNFMSVLQGKHACLPSKTAMAIAVPRQTDLCFAVAEANTVKFSRILRDPQTRQAGVRAVYESGTGTTFTIDVLCHRLESKNATRSSDFNYMFRWNHPAGCPRNQTKSGGIGSFIESFLDSNRDSLDVLETKKWQALPRFLVKWNEEEMDKMEILLQIVTQIVRNAHHSEAKMLNKEALEEALSTLGDNDDVTEAIRDSSLVCVTLLRDMTDKPFSREPAFHHRKANHQPSNRDARDDKRTPRISRFHDHHGRIHRAHGISCRCLGHHVVPIVMSCVFVLCLFWTHPRVFTNRSKITDPNALPMVFSHPRDFKASKNTITRTEHGLKRVGTAIFAQPISAGIVSMSISISSLPPGLPFSFVSASLFQKGECIMV
ncbi:hypothetical protein BLNAU_6695 [Blattamonas nauphoetae]|uniref:Uncharacterized protein n=1 Tax=Blattamonas nauphoetae TaxID=2049346 RepID=A0ABQ9Y3W5_9EUKA|nr:hypothetical protein BLNAU_6695 [Blattamonas nauphoetae]